jgi:hypothetical protein
MIPVTSSIVFVVFILYDMLFVIIIIFFQKC